MNKKLYNSMNNKYVSNKFYTIIKLVRIHEPIGFFLLLWSTLCGLWVSSKGVPDLYILVTFIFGALCMRSAGCVINDCIDYDIDKYVERTKKRPLYSGKIKKEDAWIIFLILTMISGLLVFRFNLITIFLSILALIFTGMYPFLKRYIYIPQLILGMLFSWPILMAFTVSGCIINSDFYLLFIGNILWVVIYDTQYAMVDRKCDVNIGIKSSAILFGQLDKFIIGVLQLLVLVILGLLGWQEKLSLVFYLFTLPGVAILFIWQQKLIYLREPSRCFQAFLSNNYVGILIFFGIVLGYS